MTCLTILVVVFPLIWIGLASTSSNINSLIAKANIYSYGARSDSQDQRIADLDEMKSKKDIKMIIHGYSASRTDKSIRPLVDAYLAKPVMANIFLADWSDAAGLDYASTRNAVSLVATHLARILNEFLKKFSIDSNEVHLIGHSLGAHVAGGIGKYLNGSLGRVTGLDPALPLFTPHSQDGLAATAAQFVDVIHTDFPVFGDITPRGTIDFYPHFGLAPQPGCGDFDLNALNSCSHQRSVDLYAESITFPKNFPALPCSLRHIRRGSMTACLHDIQGDGLIGASSIFTGVFAKANKDNIVFMGESVSKTVRGLYFLHTYEAPPYGTGSN